MERVSSFGLGQSMLNSAMSLQARLAEKQAASASGLVTDTYANLGAASAKVISLESTVTRVQAWADNTGSALSQVEAMYNALGDITDQLTSLRSTLSSARSDATNSTDYQTTGAAVLDDLAQLMNLQMDGRYLFAGSRTDAKPVDVTTLAAPTIPSSADTAYYQGDGETISVRVSGQQIIDYGLTANSSGFEKALRAANILANADPLDDDALTEAYDLATEALDEVLAMQGRLSLQSGRLEAAQESQDRVLSLLAESISDVTAVDVAAVTVEIAQYQSALEASYSALGTVTRLSLVDYL